MMSDRDYADLINNLNQPMPQELLDAWPNCIVADCQYKCCLRLKSDKCYPHTVGDAA